MATAAYEVYDVHQLQGSVTNINTNQEIITQRFGTIIDDVTHLAEAQATTNNILRTLDDEVSDLEMFL